MPTIGGNYNGGLYESNGFRNFKVNENYAVYTRNSGYGALNVSHPEMSVLRTIPNPNSSYDNNFGYGLGLYETTAYVGAFAQKGINGSTSSVGVVYVFDITNGSLIHTITSPNQNTGTYFGRAVDASEDYIAVYASGPTTLYIYNRSDYTLRHTIYLSSLGLSEIHNESFTADGKYLMMSWGFGAGRVVVVDMSSGSSVLTLNNPNTQSSPATSDYYGYSASMFNKKTIVGARGESAPNGQDQTGYVYVYGD
jgi:WD40 repeat protein